ncbi:MAG: polysaccharide deacetylase family protein [Saprospiraceae bacterium]
MLTVSTSRFFEPEKEYIFHVLFREMLGLEYVVEFGGGDLHILRLPNGAELQIDDWFSKIELPESLKLSGSYSPPPVHKFTNEPTSDLFAIAFFLLTRLEETWSSERDVHGRFPAEQSLAWKQGFLHRPVVNEWADWLWEALIRLGWRGERKQRQFQISISCDVDHPRLWWSNGDRAKTIAGAIFKRGDLNEANYWLKNHIFKRKDPYDVFDEWLEIFEKNNLVAQFNFMGERPRSSDCWYPLRHPFVKNLMEKIAQRGHRLGFHPSYEAFESQEVFNRELASLRQVSPVEITSGRQHYLRFSAPKTWQMWENAGLQEDSTLGYPEAEGFRCGICHDFPVFDTEQRKMLKLREKPLIAMDVTLAFYCQNSPEQAAEHLRQLRCKVEKHRGDFTLLWHNSSWNSPIWEDWKAVLRAFISE